ncbi:dihydrofolate reductase family protein [Dyadobacter pollutisoli]|uniref:Dihydrofolate reductase family protein n=1 Tax=Dyadobacter pollutisoli TaxID=2910158 RepID=A0A9E8ND26_9BACT|nr:dihydrofolate reductase family protein [Dyadobacter pollutisoli]WAC13078.1 dihydrofolate reductase family protein [Dyadobacter pollutisoli]
MRKLIATEWISLDGVFDASTMNVWFNPYHSDSRAAAIQETISDCDAMLYGRITYEMLYPYWSGFQNNEMGVAEKLNQVKKYLYSQSTQAPGWENTEVLRGDLVSEITSIKNQSGDNILVQGSGKLLNTLLKAGLIDEMRLMVQPHLAGSGQKLFDQDLNIGMQLDEIRRLEKGVTVLVYRPLTQLAVNA